MAAEPGGATRSLEGRGGDAVPGRRSRKTRLGSGVSDCTPGCATVRRNIGGIMPENGTAEDDFVVVDLLTLWNRNFHALQDCRDAERRVRDLGVRIAIEHILIQKRHLSPALAWEGAESVPPAPTALSFCQREDRVITAAVSRGVVSSQNLLGAQRVLDSIRPLGVQATLSFVLVELGHASWEQLEAVDRELTGEESAEAGDAPPSSEADAEAGGIGGTGNAKSTPHALDRRDPPREQKPAAVPVVRGKALRSLLRAIPDAEIAGLLRRTKMLGEGEIGAALEGCELRSEESERSVTLGEFLLETRLLSEDQMRAVLKAWDGAQGQKPLQEG